MTQADNRRVVDLTGGVAMVVTDLHGNWEAYTRYRERFFALRAQGRADRWLLCGDLIHSAGPAEQDHSLAMLQDVMRLQAEYGPDVITMLAGNHELPHLYPFVLSKGRIEYTSRFEHSLTDAGPGVREDVVAFLDRLPFFARTAAGVMIGHTGVSGLSAHVGNRRWLADFDHQVIVQRLDRKLAHDDPAALRHTYARLTGEYYDTAARHYLAVSGPDDPRYDHLLRQLVLDDDPLFALLWDAFFTKNELSIGPDDYAVLVPEFLATWSREAPAVQRVLVAGHVDVLGGYTIVADRQLRLASWTHALPREDGRYLLLDCAAPVESPEELLPGLGSVFT